MPRGGRTRGFTPTELMIVTSCIGLRAMMATAAVQRLGKHAEASAFGNGGREFTEAFSRFAQERGSFPADRTRAGEVPAGMGEYLRSSHGRRITPLGGRYEWDHKAAPNSLGRPFNAAIEVSGCTWTMDSLSLLDRWYDDGDLATGNIVVTDAGTTVFS